MYKLCIISYPQQLIPSPTYLFYFNGASWCEERRNFLKSSVLRFGHFKEHKRREPNHQNEEEDERKLLDSALQ